MKILIFVLSFFVCTLSFAQNDYGWYIIKKGASYKIVSAGGSDVASCFEPVKKQMKADKSWTGDDIHSYIMASAFVGILSKMSSDEPVFVVGKMGNLPLAIDPIGKIIVFEENSLIKVNECDNCGPALFLSEYSKDGNVIHENSFRWVEKTEDNHYNVLVNGYNMINIIFEDVTFMNDYFMLATNQFPSKTAE